MAVLARSYVPRRLIVCTALADMVIGVGVRAVSESERL